MLDGDRSAGSSLASSSNTMGHGHHPPPAATKGGMNQGSERELPTGGARQVPSSAVTSGGGARGGRDGEEEDETEYSLDDFEGGTDTHANHTVNNNNDNNNNNRRPSGSAEPTSSSSGKVQGQDSEEPLPPSSEDATAIENIKRRWLTGASSMDDLTGPSLSVPQSRGGCVDTVTYMARNIKRTSTTPLLP